jgi:hypothetical protein
LRIGVHKDGFPAAPGKAGGYRAGDAGLADTAFLYVKTKLSHHSSSRYIKVTIQVY